MTYSNEKKLKRFTAPVVHCKDCGGERRKGYSCKSSKCLERKLLERNEGLAETHRNRINDELDRVHWENH